MPSPLDGAAGSIVSPIDPEAPDAADVADLGQAAAAKQVQRNNQEGKYGADPVAAHTPNKSNPELCPPSWVEIELLDEEGHPIVGEKYEIMLPSNKIARGILDSNGFARIECFDSTMCKVSFPDLDERNWK